MNTYAENFNKIKTTIEKIITEDNENIQEYDIAEIVNEVSEYDLETGKLYFIEELKYTEEFWETVEKYSLNKDFSQYTNEEILDKLEEETAEENEFEIKLLRKEIIKRIENR